MSKPKTSIRRLAERAVDDVEVINSILDEGFICHVGYLAEGRPVVIPTLYARDGNRIILHGSTGSGITRAVRAGSPLSIAVTLIDGLVVARSAFHSSANYRSVVIHGDGRILEGDEHLIALDRTLEALIPGRSNDVRASTPTEVRQTATIEVPLTEVSAKVRTGPPGDDPSDLENPTTWGGVIPMRLEAGTAIADQFVTDDIRIPDYLSPYQRSRHDEPETDVDYQTGNRND